MTISATMEAITPKMAEEYLKSNSANYRNLSTAKVNSYADDMKSGNWQENGEGIVFAENGLLKDGQHRLNAIIKSGVTVPMLVVRGIANDVQIYDWGTARTNTQIAKASGYPLSSDMIGAAKILISGFHKAAPKGIVNNYLHDHHDELHDAGLITRRKNGFSETPGRKATCTLAVYVCKRLNLINDAILEDFFYVFNSGTFMPNQMRDPSPALVSSRTFITKFTNAGGSSQTYQFSVVMQALDDFKRNKNRRSEYKMSEKPMAYIQALRKMDGITTSAL